MGDRWDMSQTVNRRTSIFDMILGPVAVRGPRRRQTTRRRARAPVATALFTIPDVDCGTSPDTTTTTTPLSPPQTAFGQTTLSPDTNPTGQDLETGRMFQFLQKHPSAHRLPGVDSAPNLQHQLSKRRNTLNVLNNVSNNSLLLDVPNCNDRSAVRKCDRIGLRIVGSQSKIQPNCVLFKSTDTVSSGQYTSCSSYMSLMHNDDEHSLQSAASNAAMSQVDGATCIDETSKSALHLASPEIDSQCGGANGSSRGLSVVTSPHVSGLNIVTLNVAGCRYQTLAETLDRFPNTLLGDAARRQSFYNPATGEYFFDRHRASFDAIIYFYQSDGRIKRPETVPMDVFIREMKFFQMGPDIMEKFWLSEGYVKPQELELPKNKFQCAVYQLMEHPDSSMAARIVAFLSVFVIVLSIVSFCVETIPVLKNKYLVNVTNDDGTWSEAAISDFTNPFFAIECCCIAWFTIEFFLRFLSSPTKLAFIRSFLNIIDVVAIVPFYINLFMSDSGGNSNAMSFAVLRVLRLVRVFRIFKLSRHSVGLQILGKTFKASVQELCLLVFFLLIALVLFSSAIYFAEHGHPRSQFESIPAAFWFCIATMTTVGYGDIVPVGPWGKLVGGCTTIIGVLVLALPVPVIVANFKHFYRQETRLAHMRAIEDNDADDIPDDGSVSS